MSDTPLVSAVVVTFNSASVIDECLAGLVGDPRVEVIVVDSGSDDDSAGKAASFDGVVSIAMDENLGWSVCSNAGARSAQAPAIAFVNPDTRTTSDALVRLASRLGAEVAEVSPRFVNEDGTGQHFYFRLPTPLTGPFLYLNSGQRIDEKLGRPVVRWHLYGEKLPIEAMVAHAGAACVVVDAAEFRRLGGFDQRMWIFFSDVDLSRRMALTGRRLAVDWDVPVTHLGGGSVKALDLDRLQLILQRDYVAYGRVAFGATGRWLTVCAVWAFSGIVPAVAALLRGEPRRARECLDRARSVLRT
jgi:N-acetylglucosaminyl-diphospho-decaprenol L-rhamnosyltransferase